MNTIKALLLAASACGGAIVTTAPAHATDFSFVGNLSGANDVLLFNFSVGAPSTVTLRTWSYAGGVNAAGASIARGGFDPILALFDSTGALINQNDDGGGLVAADSVTGAHYDTFLSSILAAGNYTVSVAAYSNFAIGPNLSNGFSGGGNFVDATGNPRDTHWAFDILNVNEAVQTGGGVPEPATWALLLLGFGAIGFSMRNRKAEQRIAVTYS